MLISSYLYYRLNSKICCAIFAKICHLLDWYRFQWVMSSGFCRLTIQKIKITMLYVDSSFINWKQYN